MVSSIIFIVIISIIIYKLKYYKPVNKFWSKQPVMRCYSYNLGPIGIRPNINIIYPSHISISHNTDILTCYNFVKDNFSPYYNIDFNKFNYHWNNPQSCKFTLLHNNSYIIGFILCYPVNIIAFDNLIRFYYVDYLCIHRDFRNNNLASLLISELLMSFSNTQPFLFKKDTKQLPFLPFYTSHYYYKSLYFKYNTPSNYTINDTSNVDYELYNNVISHINPSIVINHDNIIGNVLNIYDNKTNILVCNVVWNNSTWKTGNKIVEIDYILSTINDYNLYVSICQYFYSHNFKDLLIPAISCNMNFIKIYNCETANLLNYYTYNYNLPKIKTSDILFNI